MKQLLHCLGITEDKQNFKCKSSHEIAIALSALGTSRNCDIVCIGTDRSTGDSLGPLVGTNLEKLGYKVYGTIDNPVHASNLVTTIGNISSKYILAIDACLGRMENVGTISVEKGGIRPGIAVGKDLPKIGDVAIMGIVNVGGFMEHLVLQSTRLSLVIRMANSISEGIHKYMKGEC
jgi:putative sporulation protein YyaC